jgi:hypothetical protein
MSASGGTATVALTSALPTRAVGRRCCDIISAVEPLAVIVPAPVMPIRLMDVCRAMFTNYISTEVAVVISPDRVAMIGVILNVVVFD